MSLISDVKGEIGELNYSRRNLRKFGLFVGGIFLIIGLFMEYRQSVSEWRFIFAGAGFMLLVLGAVYPGSLKYVYKFWMGLAFTLGWMVSRILLSIIYYAVMTPIGLLMRLFGRNPLDPHPHKANDSFWISRSGRAFSAEQYKKMY